MRLCRIEQRNGTVAVAIHDDRTVYPLPVIWRAFRGSDPPAELQGDDLLPLLGPLGPHAELVAEIGRWLHGQPPAVRDGLGVAVEQVRLLLPVPRPPKLLLLAGNYAAHVEEGGERAAERAETFPYVFMKPPSTTLTPPGAVVALPAVSPAAIDWELELGVIIGRGGKHIAESDALSHVAGYTVINDISNRKFRPNPDRKTRERDRFFDWLHGKWHDGFCPCGPCVASADSIPDPQKLDLRLTVNGQEMQNASTAQQVFPVAAVIEFVSRIVTLEPGDIISTGTPAGVGNSTQTYLQPGDVIHASISAIGTLVTRIEAEEA